MAVKSKKSSVKVTKKKSSLGVKSSGKGSVKKSVLKKEPKNMADLLASYGKEVKGLKRGDKVKGKVISKTSKKLYLDIDRKSEGLVAEKAFNEVRDFIRKLEIGDEVIASVIIPETPEGYTILSLREMKEEESWKRILKAKEEKKQLVVYGSSASSSGIVVETEGLTGFVPRSQLGKEVSESQKDLVGTYFKAVIIEADRGENKIVLSEREVSDARDIKLTRKALKKLKEGEVYDAKITTVANFGVFAQIEVPVDGKKQPIEGLVHISEMSWEKVEDPGDMVSDGESVKVRVIGISGDRLSLSMKKAQDDPWKAVEGKYKTDSKHKAKVIRISDFGVFAQLEPGVEGLIHMTKIPPGKKLEEGSEINVYVEGIDAKVKKISLGLVLTDKPVGYK